MRFRSESGFEIPWALLIPPHEEGPFLGQLVARSLWFNSG